MTNDEKVADEICSNPMGNNRARSIVEKSHDIKINSDGIIQINGDVSPAFNVPTGREILIISEDQSYLTHGIHKFPAKFFPELPRYLIKKYSKKGALVLDPMCGSGTVILESILNNRNAIGIDIDPIARFLTKVKTTPLNKDKLINSNLWLDNFIKSKTFENFKPKIPEFHYRDKWFKTFILKELGIIKTAIGGILTDEYFKDFHDKERNDIYDFFSVIFSSIIRAVSNADPHCTRTVIRKKLNKNLQRGSAFRAFHTNVSKQIPNMIEFSKIYETLTYKDVSIPNTNASNTGISSDSVDLAITSPPYINAVDYPRTHQLEMYWLGLVQEPLTKMKRKYMGTETVYKDEYNGLKRSGYKTLDPLLEEIYNIDPRRSYIIYKFFEDVKVNLKEIYRVLKPNSKYCIAIGNNTIRGKYVKSHEILMEIAQSGDVGFELERHFHSGVINHFIKIPRTERMLGEWIIVLKKP